MAELKTINVHQTNTGMTPTTKIEETHEIIATENMKIVGFSFAHTYNGGHEIFGIVSRTGQKREAGSYIEGEELCTDDGVMFYFKTIIQADNVYSQQAYGHHMLPDGHWFFLEKGERIYVHIAQANTHSSATYSNGCDVTVYYY